MASQRSLRIGAVEDAADDLGGIIGETAALTLFPSWGSLLDHFDAARNGGLDGALLPRELVGSSVPSFDLPWRSHEARRAAVLVRTAQPPTGGRRFLVGRALRMPSADARLRAELIGLGLALDGITLTQLPPRMLVDNAASGLIDAALLTGERAETALRTPPPGVTVHRLNEETAAVLDPPLALVCCA